MTLAVTSTFTDMHIDFAPWGDVAGVRFHLTSDPASYNIYIDRHGALVGDDIATLRTIYATHGGFPATVDGDGDALTFVTPTLGGNFPQRHRTFDLLADYGESFANPFLTQRQGGHDATYTQAVLFQRSATKPTAAASFDSEGNLDQGSWHKDRAAAVAAASSGTVWLCSVSATRNPQGNWHSSPATITAEWQVEYSVDGSSNWHVTRADTDKWMRFRLADGTFAIAPLANVRAGNRVWFNNENTIFVGGLSSSNTIELSPQIAELNDYGQLGFQYFPRLGNGSNTIGRVYETLIARPSGGWDVNNASRDFGIVYAATHGLSVEFERRSLPLPEAAGSYDSLGLIRSFRMRFQNPSNAAARGGPVSSIFCHNFSSTFDYCSFRVFGIIV